MNELIQAAKAVIEWWRHTDPSDLPVEQLIAAVERAESAHQAELERIKQIITYQFGDLVSDLDDVFAMIDDDSEHLPLGSEHLPAGKQKANPPNVPPGFCNYPECNCPFDAPSDKNWCARGLPHVTVSE